MPSSSLTVRARVLPGIIAAVLVAAPAAAWVTRLGPSNYFLWKGVFAAAADGSVFVDVGWRTDPRIQERAIEIESTVATATGAGSAA